MALPDIEDCVPPDYPRHTAAYHRFDPAELGTLRDRLLAWYDENHRLLPWRRTPAHSSKAVDAVDLSGLSPQDFAYREWVSEIMLQQTQVATVISYFNKWVARWPTIASLAEATPEEVNEMWAGLGYYRRARFLHEGAKAVMKDHGGILPSTADKLLKIPGIGAYTAGAIASISFGQVAPVVDGNVIRVLGRMRALGAEAKHKIHWELAGALVDPTRPGDFNQALMELGALVCRKSSPSCGECPVRDNCLAWEESRRTAEWKAACAKRDITPAATPAPAPTGTPGCDVCGTWEGLRSWTDSVTKYPRGKTKAAQRPMIVQTHIVELMHDAPEESRFLLVQRPETGLLASLWEFPTVVVKDGEANAEDEDDAEEGAEPAQTMDGLLSALGLSAREVISQRAVGSFVHNFSHIKQTINLEHVRIRPLTLTGVTATAKTRLVTAAEIEGASISTGMKKAYQMLSAEPAAPKTKGKGRKRKKDDDATEEDEPDEEAAPKTKKVKSSAKGKKRKADDGDAGGEGEGAGGEEEVEVKQEKPKKAKTKAAAVDTKQSTLSSYFTKQVKAE